MVVPTRLTPSKKIWQKKYERFFASTRDDLVIAVALAVWGSVSRGLGLSRKYLKKVAIGIAKIHATSTTPVVDSHVSG